MPYKIVQTKVGGATGLGLRWEGGQCIIIVANKGLMACGILDVKIADKWDLAVAISRGTPQNPLVTDKDLLNAKIMEVTRKARELGIEVGMVGREALKKLM
jgi:uncharacterized protein YunC (DUF1805 family)